MNFYAFIPKLLSMSLTASVSIVLVLLLRLMLKKAPKVISYALWAVVLFRLLCPVSIESGFSLFGLMDAPTAESTTLTTSIEYVLENIVHAEYPVVTAPAPGIGSAINNTLPGRQEQLVAELLEALIVIATYVWLAGALVMAAYSVVSYHRLRQKLLTASPLRENIYLADEITSPFVMGLLRPKIYLPSDMEEREQAYIICHEQHHIRRGDHIIKALAFLALSIHWFNPLVWVAFIYSSKDMEMSCDEAVVKKMGDGVLADYTASLLSLATGKHIIAGMPLAFGEGDTKGRIRNLANWRRPAFWVVLLAVIACVTLGVGLLTDPAGANHRDYGVDGYFLIIGADGVVSIEVSGSNPSGGGMHADGTPFKLGEKVWLEQLQGVTNLRGITITALGAEEEIIYEFSVPEGASDAAIAELVASDPWLLVPASFDLTSEDTGVPSDLPHYPVRFDPDEIQAAIDGTANAWEPGPNSARLPESPVEFLFASGAGGWGTTLTLQPDGSFTGSYSDADMGAGAAEYPNGVCYVSEFAGRFTDIQQISDHAWSMKLMDLTTEQEPGQTWSEGGVLYIAADPHGVSGGEEFILYAPGTPADLIPAECRDWWPDAYRWRNGEIDLLEGWGLCNLKEGTGFYTSWLS